MRLHIIGLFHTKNQESFSHCAFTGRHQYSSTEIRNRVYLLEKEKRERQELIESPRQYSPELLEKYGQK